jgi:hypothetical protein
MAVKMPVRNYRNMSAKAAGEFSPFLGVASPAGLDRTPRRERRTRSRTLVHWPVLFRYRQSEALETITENLSSQGFYCLSRIPIPLGEAMLCWLTVPTHDPSAKSGTILLECNVRVVRSDAADVEGSYGIACRIDDFRLTDHTRACPAE